MELHIEQMESPIGTILIAGAPDRLYALDFEESKNPVVSRLKRRLGEVEIRNGSALRPVRERVEAYFRGELDALDDLTAEPGGTPFQREVWTALRRIPTGSTASYGEIAAAVGRPAAVRAVGMINSKNPIAIVIPCHRVVGRDGSLTGYAGGLERKRWLLEHEGCSVAAQFRLF